MPFFFSNRSGVVVRILAEAVAPFVTATVKVRTWLAREANDRSTMTVGERRGVMSRAGG
jgi:hypothetical protein